LTIVTFLLLIAVQMCLFVCKYFHILFRTTQCLFQADCESSSVHWQLIQSSQRNYNLFTQKRNLFTFADEELTT